ncbi:dihydropyrimidinase [Brenneria sp. 4F2]|nr:dihydropyrimidinase [Brenneria bubanii]
MFDLIIRGGRIITATDDYRADIGIKDGRIAALGALSDARETIDAAGLWVMPGGIEGHCHIEQESSSGLMSADDYYSGTVSAAFGGNTTIVPFAAQMKGQRLENVLEVYQHRAAPKAVLDYAWHLIITDPTVPLADDLPRVVARGVPSFKFFMTYDAVKMNDGDILNLLTLAAEHGALAMVHAENNDIIKWMSQRLLERGHTAPRYHAISHPAAAEIEAIGRVTQLAAFVGCPLMVVHVSTAEGAEIIARARLAGAKLYSETCPQYLFLTRDDLDRPGREGAKFMCSPPVRDTATQQGLWRHLQAGTFDFFSSDHAPYRFDASGKFFHGPDATFRQIANGMPGIGLRLPLLFSEGVMKGRITPQQFVALTSTNAAKTLGMFPQKGAIAIGADADLALWDPNLTRRVTHADQHDNMDYTPFEGMTLRGCPVRVISRGETVVADGELRAAAGRGRFVPRRPPDCTGMPGVHTPELDPALNFGAVLAPVSTREAE